MKSNKMMVLVVVLSLLVVVLGGYTVYDKEFNKNNDNTNIKNSDEQSTDNNAINYNDYVGTWYIEGDNYYGTYERELKITLLDEKTIKLNLTFYRLAYYDNITVNIDNIIMYFSGVDEGTGKSISGTIKFDNNTITLNITQSQYDLVSVGALIFTNKTSD